ncbi:rhodanese-like domain-containing protein [Parvibaculum sp.]|uniref:rhodanese-like domain-containing protein n=1 Tax=Parvibaculum sp. TaxID=2024848 RepID=UPI00320F362A
MALKTISPSKARKLIGRGALVVDVRERGEFAREHIEGARNEPLSSLGRIEQPDPGAVIIYHCKSGMRTRASAKKLEEAANCEAFILEGGIDAWKATGLPVVKGSGDEAAHQMQIVGLSVVFIGVALGMSVNPAFYALAAAAAVWLILSLFRRG